MIGFFPSFEEIISYLSHKDHTNMLRLARGT
jgi:hypothetical protein